MPTIPLIRGGETVKTADIPKPVLDTLRRPTVDLSGVISAQGRLGKSARRPDVPLAIGAAPYDALGSVGQAIERTGSIVGAVALKRQEAETFNQDFETQLAIKDAAGQLRSVYENPHIPPNEYEAHRQRIMTGLADQVGNRKDMTPEARDTASRRLRAFDVDSRHDANLTATKGEFKLRQDNVGASLTEAMNEANRPKFDSIMRYARDEGVYFSTDQAQWDQRYEDHWKQKDRESDAQIAKARDVSAKAKIGIDPAGWMAAHPTPEKGQDPDEHTRWRSFAEGMERDQAADASEDVNTAIVSGDITTAKEIDALRGPQYTPLLKEQLKANLATFDKRKSDLVKQERGTENFVNAWVELDKLDFDAMPKDKAAAEFARRIGEAKQTIPDDLVGEITQRLHAKFGVPGADKGARPEIEKQVSDSLKAMYDGWEFGPTGRFVGVGQPGANARGNVDDVTLELAARARFAAAQKEMSKFTKAYPEASETAILEKLSQVRNANNSRVGGQQISNGRAAPVAPPPPVNWRSYLPEIAPVPTPEPAKAEPVKAEPEKPKKSKADREAEEAERAAQFKASVQGIEMPLPSVRPDEPSNSLLPDITYTR